MKSLLATFVLLAASAITTRAALVVTLPTPTATGSVVFTEDISFTITSEVGGTLGFIVFDEWVVSDGSRSAIALTTPYYDLLYSVNGGPTQALVMNYAGLIDNFAGTINALTPNDGYFGARDILSFAGGDVITLKAATYTLPITDITSFNPQANQTFTGNAFLISPFGYALSNTVSVGSVPEPSCPLLMMGGLGALTLRRRRKSPNH